MVLLLRTWRTSQLAEESPTNSRLIKRFQSCAKVFHEQHKLFRIERRRLKAKFLVESHSLVIKSMNQNGTSSNGVGCACGTPQSVDQECLAKTGALFTPVNCQSRKQDDADRVPCQSFGDAGGGLFFSDCSSGKRIIADDVTETVNDISAGGIALLVGKGEALQPIVQRRLPAIERRQVVIAR